MPSYSEGDPRVTIGFLLSGMIAGYIARKKGWLYGAFVPLVFYCIVFLFAFVAGYILFSQLSIKHSMPFNPQEYLRIISEGFQGKALEDFVKRILGEILIPTIMVGFVGGAVGERIYKSQTKRKIRT